MFYHRSCHSTIVPDSNYRIFLTTATLIIALTSIPINCFTSSGTKTFFHHPITVDRIVPCPPLLNLMITPKSYRTATSQLNVLWFGGTETQTDSESCELVEVRIDRTSPNSRRIGGEILVPRPMDDVWAIITDYDNLAIHVPNLVESRRVNPSVNPKVKPGNGTYACRLYQKGAQKIVGFEFGASLTMDMVETVEKDDSKRMIEFKCVESPFFSEFDGQWKVTPIFDPEDSSNISTKIEYVVDVRPRGPVPVLALEWRIREDVPTNLRAVKAASMTLGFDGVSNMRDRMRNERNGRLPQPGVKRKDSRLNPPASLNNIENMMEASVANGTSMVKERYVRQLAPVRVEWYEDETMATYLQKKKRL